MGGNELFKKKRVLCVVGLVQQLWRCLSQRPCYAQRTRVSQLLSALEVSVTNVFRRNEGTKSKKAGRFAGALCHENLRCIPFFTVPRRSAMCTFGKSDTRLNRSDVRFLNDLKVKKNVCENTKLAIPSLSYKIRNFSEVSLAFEDTCTLNFSNNLSSYYKKTIFLR